jgi:alpha-galactosidase
MSPLHFHPASKTFAAHPEWACQPVSSALLAYNKADNSGSNEAGIVEWGAQALPHIEASIRRAIEQWGVTYFKFDFIAWLDCAGQNDMYEFRDAFVAMLDRLRAAHPDVVFSIDETNDYRLFPFNSTTRGPTWFQNGNPDVKQLLHNLWDLSPYVPASSLGQAVATDAADPVDTRMAAALLSHVTFFSDIRKLDAGTVAAARRWLDFYKAHRGAFTDGVVYPLLADPLDGGWTALQSWDGRRGALLVFRQDASDDTRHVTLENLPAGDYELTSAPDGASLGTADLSDGLDVTLPPRGARVIVFNRTSQKTGGRPSRAIRHRVRARSRDRGPGSRKPSR